MTLQRILHMIGSLFAALQPFRQAQYRATAHLWEALDVIQQTRRSSLISDFGNWMIPLGLSSRLFFESLSLKSWQNFQFGEFQKYCKWMGQKSFHLVALAAVFVSIALTMECAIELQKYRAEDLSGMIIAIGLLRELGPLTVSLGWCARVAALLSEEASNLERSNERDFAQNFVFPRYLAAIAMSVPLGAYGLFFGFITAALTAPLMGVSTTTDFLESAKLGIHEKDLIVYFLKLIVVNPTIGVFAGCAAGRIAQTTNSFSPAANAVTATFLVGYIANTMITFAAYFP